jgi:hypothetical protein
MVVIGHHSIGRNFQRKHAGQTQNFILNPLPAVIIVFPGEIVSAAEKASPDSAADDVHVGCFPGSNLCISGLRHGYNSIRMNN